MNGEIALDAHEIHFLRCRILDRSELQTLTEEELDSLKFCHNAMLEIRGIAPPLDIKRIKQPGGLVQ